MVPHIVEYKRPGSYELVVATPSRHFLSEEFHDFSLVEDYDPFEPADEDVRAHGIWEAQRRTQTNALNNAAEATRRTNGWGYGPADWAFLKWLPLAETCSHQCKEFFTFTFSSIINKIAFTTNLPCLTTIFEERV